MNRMGIPQPDYTPDGVLAEIARVVPFFKGTVWEKLGDNGKQWPIQEGCIGMVGQRRTGSGADDGPCGGSG